LKSADHIPVHSTQERPWCIWLNIVLLPVILLAVYAPALQGDIVWDDDSWMKDLLHLKQDWYGLWRIWTEPTAMQQYYPMTGTSFWLDHQLWGEWTLPYHVENVLLHCSGAFLLWQLLRRLEVPGAWLTGAVFALHPVMVESVAWITERKNVLSLVFMLGGLLAYDRFEQEVKPVTRRRWYALALVLFVLALCSKITAFVFAPTVLLIAWWRHDTVRWKADILPTLPFFTLTLALGGMIWWLETYHVGAEGKAFSATMSERIITAGRAFWFYPWKLLWPLDLCFIYPDWRGVEPRWGDWAWPLSVPAVLAALWLARNKMGRGPLAAMLFYLGAAFPVLGILNVYGAVFAPVWDHWAHVPALGILTLACAALARLAERTHIPWALPAFAGVLLPLLAVQTWRQTPQYAGKETLWIETIKRNPAAWLAQNNHGSALVTEGRLEEAVSFFKSCLQTKPDYAEAWNNLGGALVQLAKYEESLDAYRHAIALDAELSPYTRHNMGNALLTIGRTDEAIEQFHASLATLPDYEEALNSLGAALTQIDRLDEALDHLRHAIRVKADYHQAHNNLGSTLQKKGDFDGALAAYEKAAALSPKFVEARFNIGELLYKKGDLDGAIAHYHEVIAIKPDHAKSYYNLGLCFTEQKKMSEAEAAYRKAIEHNPAYANAHNNLANNLLNTGRTHEAIPYFEKAIEADARQLAALNNLAWVLATDTDASLRDGAKAIQYARRAAELTNNEHPVVLSTLAAALAETGQFGEAMDTVRKAFQVVTAQGDQNMASSLTDYLKLYEARQPLRIERKK
jgi:tetratricopeptide (TPR) repeat protein